GLYYNDLQVGVWLVHHWLSPDERSRIWPQCPCLYNGKIRHSLKSMAPLPPPRAWRHGCKNDLCLGKLNSWNTCPARSWCHPFTNDQVSPGSSSVCRHLASSLKWVAIEAGL
ncbi:hypothetical protein LEMLEM_LOCUS21374, partial [Lemmus lemmus]